VSDHPLERWSARFPEHAKQTEGDPRVYGICAGCGMEFAWYGYTPNCGWCHETLQEQLAGTFWLPVDARDPHEKRWAEKDRL
jgi:hypothetical protein